jgi:NADH:ubiquinone oxidoreductase subunit E
MQQNPIEEIKLLICQNRTCRKQGANAVLKAFKAIENSGITIVSSGCLGQCGNGPIVLILPQEIWYYHVKKEDVNKILKH